MNVSQRSVSIVLGAAVVVLAVLLAYKSVPGKSEAVSAPLHAEAGADKGELATSAANLDKPEGGLLLADLRVATDSEKGTDAGAGLRMPDGTPVPPLPSTAPRAVRFGVVLVTHAGAQGAGANARPKGDARTLADKLAADARTDFRGAVQRGDTGSMDDVGRIQRGVLEPAVEFVLFTTPVGSVSEPIETPRGYWIVKRLE